jgi:D-aminoacyl-tRNA deacylase
MPVNYESGKMKLITASLEDPAAKNIAERLLELYDFEPMTNQPNVWVCGGVMLTTIAGEAFRPSSPPLAADEMIFASRHASESGKPTLTAHVPGEISDRKLAIASPPTLKSAIRELIAARDELGLQYEVTLEATHHGPTGLKVPVTFVEIGSSLTEWRDKGAAEAAARATMAAATSPINGRQAIGFGGPHYAPRHTQVVLKTDVCIGHVLPKYVTIDEELVKHAIARTSGGVELLALDWKGLDSSQRQHLQQIANKLGVRAVRESELLHQAKV